MITSTGPDCGMFSVPSTRTRERIEKAPRRTKPEKRGKNGSFLAIARARPASDLGGPNDVDDRPNRLVEVESVRMHDDGIFGHSKRGGRSGRIDRVAPKEIGQHLRPNGRIVATLGAAAPCPLFRGRVQVDLE